MLVLLAVSLAWVPATPAQKPAPAPLLPFLEEFKAPTITIVTKEIAVVSALGKVKCLLARPEVPEALPAVLLIPDQAGLGKWMKQNTSDLAGLGYVVLAVDLRHHAAAPDADLERGRAKVLADLAAAVHWLRRRPEVIPDRMGVVGWSWGAEQALALAAQCPLQACILCDGNVSVDPPTLAGLRATPVLGIFGDKVKPASARALQQALAKARIPHHVRYSAECEPGFMNPENARVYHHDQAEDAWVHIYEFLGKHVEDAPPVTLEPVSPKAVATIADIMRSVNDARGVRGTLIKELEEKPATANQWQRIRANAALAAEAGNLLHALTPKRGTARDWAEQTKAFTSTAEHLVVAAEQRDHAAANLALAQWSKTCAACHEAHR